MTTTHPKGTRGGAGQGFPVGEPVAAREPGPQRPGAERPQRPLALTGAIAACAAAGAGLATLTVVAAIAWIAAVHIGLGAGLPGVLRTAVQLWLVGHHVGFDLHSAGKIGLLPLGLLLVPGALLWRAGRWVVRSGGVQRLRHVGYAAVALALPYGLLTGALAVASRTAASAPSPVEAAVAGFLLAFAAGGLGGARALAPWARLIGLLPDRARCLVVGVTGSLAVLAGAGALLTGASLVAHAHDFRLASDALSPGLPGAALLLLAGLGYLPNAIIWAMAYMLGPGFAFGVGTIVAPTGTLLGPLPVFPMLTALPAGSPGPHPAPSAWTGLAVLAVPYLAGVFGGLLTVRTAPTPTVEAAPLWGFASGVLTGGVVGVLAMFSGGSLGTGRLAVTGPVAWQVGAVAALELGIAAAISAGLANWLLLRRVSAAASSAAAPATSGPGDEDPAGEGTDDDTAGGPAGGTGVDDTRAEGAGVAGVCHVDGTDAADTDVAGTDVAGTDVAGTATGEADGEDTDGEETDVPEDDGGAAAWVPENDDGGHGRVAMLSPVTAEDLASLAKSPGADTPVLPVLPAIDAAGEFGYLAEAPDITADRFGYLPEPPEIAEYADDAEPVGPPPPPVALHSAKPAPTPDTPDAAQSEPAPDAPDGPRPASTPDVADGPEPAPAGEAADHAGPPALPPAFAALTRLATPVTLTVPADVSPIPTRPDTEPTAGTEPDTPDAAQPGEPVNPADQDAGKPAGQATEAGRPGDEPEPAASESPDDDEPADDDERASALGHVIFLRPRDGRGQDPDREPDRDLGHEPDRDPRQHPESGGGPDRDPADDATVDPAGEPGGDGPTGRGRPAAPGLPLS